jgi:hypothetical protein
MWRAIRNHETRPVCAELVVFELWAGDRSFAKSMRTFYGQPVTSG